MNTQISKTIDLIKKSYNQPILFHLLHSHLSYLLTKTISPISEITDDWSRLLIFSCHQNNSPNQGLEIKLQQNLKRFRPPFDNEKRLKTMIVCYYLINRTVSLVNHVLIFELVSNFLGISDYFDGLILKIFSKILLCKVFSLEANKKMKEDSIVRIQEIIKSTELSEINKIRSLVCFITGNIEPFKIDFISIESDFKSFKILETICLYVKYTSETSFIMNILPDDEFFIKELKNFMNFDFNFEGSEHFLIKDCNLLDKEIFDKIKIEFSKCSDKKRFISELLDFISNLN